MKHPINKVIAAAALLAVTFAIAFSQSGKQQSKANQADVEAINKLREQEMAAFSAAEVNTLLNLVTNDVVVMPPNEPTLAGKDALRSWAENLYKQFTVKGKYTASNPSNIVLAGDWAFERLAFTLTMTPVAGGEPIQEIGKGIHIYRRQADGSWKIAQDIWNTDNPPEAGQ
jgi:ketosteroid isomerase-like protein